MSFKAYWIIIPPRHNVILKSSEFPSEALLGSSAFGPGSEGWSHGTNGYDRELCGGKYGDVMRYKVVNPIYKWISYDNHPLNPSKIQSIMGYHMIIIDNTYIYITHIFDEPQTLASGLSERFLDSHTRKSSR